MSTIVTSPALLDITNNTNAGFTIDGAASGTYAYSISSSGGGTAVTGSGSVTSATQSVSGINVSALPAGTLTFSVTVTPGGGNPATPVTATAQLSGATFLESMSQNSQNVIQRFMQLQAALATAEANASNAYAPLLAFWTSPVFTTPINALDPSEKIQRNGLSNDPSVTPLMSATDIKNAMTALASVQTARNAILATIQSLIGIIAAS